MSKYAKNHQLPKASLIVIRGFKHPWWFHTVRIANAREFYIFRRLNILVRRPWLSSSAKQLHPELFKSSEADND